MATTALTVLGIDPGLARVGYGVLRVPVGQRRLESSHVVAWGVIETAAGRPDGDRLLEIHHDLTQLLDHYQPQAVAIEQLFFFKNAKTMVPVCQARGVILMALTHHGRSQAGFELKEFTPMQVKQAITGYGKAPKTEVLEDLVQLLGLNQRPKPDDAADALAMAVTYWHSRL